MQHTPAIALFLFSLSWLVSCSEQPCTPGCYELLQLTEESLGHFTAHLANGPTDPLVSKLQRSLGINQLYQKLCMKYIIGSVAIFGKVNECSLNTIHESCRKWIVVPLSGLLDELVQRNDLDTIAQFAAESVWYNREFANLFKSLMKEDWKAMEGVAMRVLEILKDDRMESLEYRFMLWQLPAEQQYRMVEAGDIPVERIDFVYYTREDDLTLREVFFLARYSDSPNPEIRRCIAGKFPFFKQFLADDWAMTNLKDPCPDNVPELPDDILWHISRFMDVETLVFVMPLVCRAWRKSYWRAVLCDARVHDLYMLDLGHTDLSSIHTNLTWRYSLQNGADALEYLGQCIREGALCRAKPTRHLKRNVEEYLRMVVKGRVFPTRFKDRDTQYETFVELLEMVYGACDSMLVALDKPEFLTSEEYERVVYHFVYERRWVLRLSESLIVDDMPRLFSIIKEDEKLMKELVDRNFHSPAETALVLAVCGQTRNIPDRLARLVFGRADSYKGLVDSTDVSSGEYYMFIAESGILPNVMKEHYDRIDMLPRFLIPFVLYFKDHGDMIDMIAASISWELGGRGSSKLQDVKLRLKMGSYRRAMKLARYPVEDVEFFKGVMMRCGLL